MQNFRHLISFLPEKSRELPLPFHSPKGKYSMLSRFCRTGESL